MIPFKVYDHSSTTSEVDDSFRLKVSIHSLDIHDNGLHRMVDHNCNMHLATDSGKLTNGYDNTDRDSANNNQNTLHVVKNSDVVSEDDEVFVAKKHAFRRTSCPSSLHELSIYSTIDMKQKLDEANNRTTLDCQSQCSHVTRHRDRTSKGGCKWTIPDPGSQKLKWNKPPLTVLVVKKMFDEGAMSAFKQLVLWLIEKKNMVVFVESLVLEDKLLKCDQHFQDIRSKLKVFVEKKDDLTNKVDFIICLGGDGTLLYASSLFQKSVPPVMAFNLGSLGFLTPFDFKNFRDHVKNVLEGNASLLLRYRLKSTICKKHSNVNKPTQSPTDPSINRTSILVFNEVVVDRGQSSYLTNLDLYVEGRLVTSAQGDGIIISTPTGSTAYAVAAGASMVHPNVPAIVITPICPHSLSFRPIVVPAGVEIKIMVSPESRNTAWVSFDGHDRQELLPGEVVRITTAQYPVPSLCAKDQIDDWFDSLAECLHWNVRRQQKPMPSGSSVTSLDSLLDQNEFSS